MKKHNITTRAEQFNLMLFMDQGFFCCSSKETEKYKQFLESKNYDCETDAKTFCNGKEIFFTMFRNLDF